LIDALRLLILSSHRHKKMRLAVTAWTLPLRHSEVCRSLLAKGLGGLPFDHFLKYEEGHPEWLAPEVGEIADFAEAHLEDCLNLSRRDSALASLFPMLLASLREKQYSEHGPVARWENLLPQVEWASGELAGLFDD
jgi:hypothetical protein